MNALIALDGSATAAQALALAGTLLAGKETEVTVLHVVPRHLIYGKGGPVVAECDDPTEAQTAAHGLLAAAAQTLRAQGVGPTIRTAIEVGDPAELILAVAAQGGTDLIVLGSRGLNAAQRFLLGAVSSKVITHAHCAVLVTHPQREPTPAAVAEGVAVATA